MLNHGHCVIFQFLSRSQLRLRRNKLLLWHDDVINKRKWFKVLNLFVKFDQNLRDRFVGDDLLSFRKSICQLIDLEYQSHSQLFVVCLFRFYSSPFDQWQSERDSDCLLPDWLWQISNLLKHQSKDQEMNSQSVRLIGRFPLLCIRNA